MHTFLGFADFANAHLRIHFFKMTVMFHRTLGFADINIEHLKLFYHLKWVWFSSCWCALFSFVFHFFPQSLKIVLRLSTICRRDLVSLALSIL